MANFSDLIENQENKHPVLEVTDLKKHYVLRSGIGWSARKRFTPLTASPFRSGLERRWGWWEKADVENPRWA